VQPTGPKGARKAETTPEARKAANRQRAARQAEARAALSVAEAEARLKLQWSTPLSHQAFYSSVYRPSVLRANQALAKGSAGVMLPPPDFGSIASGTRTPACAPRSAPSPSGRWRSGWGTRTRRRRSLSIRTSTKKANHTDEMAALGALAAQPTYGENVVPLWA
jgi:hypothetical protein